MEAELRIEIDKALDVAIADSLRLGALQKSVVIDQARSALSKIWARAQSALALDRMSALADSRIAKLKRPSASSPNQMSLGFPGFDHVPSVVRCAGRLVPTLHTGVSDVEVLVAALKKKLKPPSEAKKKVQSRRQAAKRAEEKKQYSEWNRILRAMRYFAKKDDPEVTTEKVLYRMPEYEQLRAVRKAAIASRWAAQKRATRGASK